MARLRLTPDDFAGLAALRDFSPEAVEQVAKALSDGSVILRPSELEPALASHTSAAKAAADILVKLAFVSRVTGQGPDKLLSEVAQAVRDVWSPEQVSAWQISAPRVLELAKHERVQVLAKALELKYAHASIYDRVQIITDVRPVFDVARNAPVAAVISHTLQITFHRDGRHESVTMALDEKDVEQLIEQASTAKQKAVAMLAFLKGVGSGLRVEEAGGVGDE